MPGHNGGVVVIVHDQGTRGVVRGVKGTEGVNE